MGQVEKLKEEIESSREEREINLLLQIADLKKRVFELSESLRISGIRMNIMERKKQQAVNEALEKKEQDVKVQKILAKTLQEKIARLEEENRKKKKDLHRILFIYEIVVICF